MPVSDEKIARVVLSCCQHAVCRTGATKAQIDEMAEVVERLHPLIRGAHEHVDRLADLLMDMRRHLAAGDDNAYCRAHHDIEHELWVRRRRSIFDAVADFEAEGVIAAPEAESAA